MNQLVQPEPRYNRNQSVNAHHVTWATKYRSPRLSADVRDHAELYISHICKHKNINLLALSVQVDHVHVYVELARSHSVADAVGIIKWYSSLCLRTNFPRLQTINGRPVAALWQRNYFSRSIGGEGAAVSRYIRNQEPDYIYNSLNAFGKIEDLW
jgi:putative transposase